MVFIVPVKRVTYTRMKRFSQYVDLETSTHFVLQKRKSSKSNSGRPNYRILTKGNTYYELAYANDLNQMREREWKYVTEQIPRLMPVDLDEKTRLVWIIAHISCRAIDVDGARDQTGNVDLDQIEAQRRAGADHSDHSGDEGGNGSDNAGAATAAASSASLRAPAPVASASAPGLTPAGLSAASSQASSASSALVAGASNAAGSAGNAASAGSAAGTVGAAGAPAHRPAGTKHGSVPGIIHGATATTAKKRLPKGSTLVPFSTWPLRGLVPFLMVIAATNMPVLLLREATSKTFLATLAVLNIIFFLFTIAGVPASLGITVLHPASSLAAGGSGGASVLHASARALLLGADGEYYYADPAAAAGAHAAAAAAGGDDGFGSESDGDAGAAPTGLRSRLRRGSATASEGGSSDGDLSSEDEDAVAVAGGATAAAPVYSGLVPGASNAGKASDVTPRGITPGCTIPVSTGPGDVNAFSDPQGESWPLRCGPNYKKNKKKANGAPSLFNIVGMDVFRSQKKIIHAAQHINLDHVRTLKPAPYVSLNSKFDQGYEAAKAEQAVHPPFPRPDPAAKIIPGTGANTGGQVPFNFGTLDKKMIFIVNFSMPTYEPSMMAPKGDGETLTLVWYLLATDETQRDLLNANGPQIPAVALLKRLAESDFDTKEGQDMMLRMKALPRLTNAEDFSFNWALRKTISQYNGKPFLTRPQHMIYRGDGYLEYFLDIHKFCYMARNVLYNFIPKMENIILDWGFTIEAYDDEEQPEVLLGSMRLFKVNVNAFPSWEMSLAALKQSRAAAAESDAAAPAVARAGGAGASASAAIPTPAAVPAAAAFSPLAQSMAFSPAGSVAAPHSASMPYISPAYDPSGGASAGPTPAGGPSSSLSSVGPGSSSGAGGAGLDRPNFAQSSRRSATSVALPHSATLAVDPVSADHLATAAALRARTPTVTASGSAPLPQSGSNGGRVVAAATAADAADGAVSPRATAKSYYNAQYA
jgi:hypothetical protein